MIALMTLAALVLYGLLCIGVVCLVVKWARKRGRSPKRWGIIAGLVMYHLVFWDFLPTLLVYHYCCATKAGLWVYKTPEQWKAENPGVAETLTWREISPVYEMNGEIAGRQLNERILRLSKKSEYPIIPIRRSEYTILDINNGEVLVKQVTFGAGYAGENFLRFWTNLGFCQHTYKKFGEIANEYKEINGVRE